MRSKTKMKITASILALLCSLPAGGAGAEAVSPERITITVKSVGAVTERSNEIIPAKAALAVFEPGYSAAAMPWLNPGEPLPETRIIDTTPKQSDVDALARIIWWEARGDSRDGMLAVGQVVINRTKSPLYPDTIQKVISQKNQFSPYDSPSYFTKSISAECVEAARYVLEYGYDMPEDVLWFRSDVKKTVWNDAVFFKTIGGHHFYIAD